MQRRLFFIQFNQKTFSVNPKNLSQSNTYTSDSYQLGMNASNPYGATSCLFLSTDCSRAVFRYNKPSENPSNPVYANGTNISGSVKNFVDNVMSAHSFQDSYIGPSPSNKRATVGVTSGKDYIISNQPLYYGWYTSTNPYNNSITGAGHNSYNAVFIPIYGHGYTCTVSGSYINYQIIQDTATGFLVYDVDSNSIIDWMSESNVLYQPNGYFGYEFNYGVYADLELTIS